AQSQGERRRDNAYERGHVVVHRRRGAGNFVQRTPVRTSHLRRTNGQHQDGDETYAAEDQQRRRKALPRQRQAQTAVDRLDGRFKARWRRRQGELFLPAAYALAEAHADLVGEADNGFRGLVVERQLQKFGDTVGVGSTLRFAVPPPNRNRFAV